MNQFIVLFCLIFSFNVNAQCEYCSNLEFALENPLSVLELDLRASGLRDIPKEINQFQNLRVLNLSNNFIVSIDFEKIQLPSLEQLIIENNPGFFALHLPGIENALPELKLLNLSNNGIRYISTEIAKLEKLETLDLSDNNLHQFPTEIEEMKGLKRLNLANNGLRGSNYLFANAWNLKELDLSKNDSLVFDKLINSLLFKDSLMRVSLSFRNFHFTSKNFNDLSIETFELVDTQIEKISGSLGNNRSIKKMVFDNCTFTKPDVIYGILGKMDSLNIVEFRNMVVPEGFDRLKNIEKLIFNRSAVESISDFDQLSKMVKIELIDSDINVPAQLAKSVSKREAISLAPDMVGNDTKCIKDVEEHVEIISSEKGAVIELDGSKYEIPAEAFLTDNGEIYVGQVKVEIKEYLDPLDNFIAGKPMVFNANEDANLFSSNGMLEFEAFDVTGSILKPNPDNIIQVELTDLQPDENTDLYVFNAQTKNWDLIGKPQSTEMDQRLRKLVDSINALPNMQLIFTRIVYPFTTLNIKTRLKDPSLFDFMVQKHTRSEIREASEETFFFDHESAFNIGKISWSVDTLMSDSLRNLFTEIRGTQKLALKLWRRGKKNPQGLPRVISNLEITPNFERDVYILSFDFKGQNISFPVYNDMSTSARNIQNKERSFHYGYSKKDRRDNRELEKIKEKQKNYIERMAPIMRQRLIDAINGSNILLPENTGDKLRFGLRSFGLINCDFFSRDVPDTYIVLDTIAKDQFGKEVTIPYVVNHVMMASKVFFSTTSANVPYYFNKNNYIVFSISDSEIGVIKTTDLSVSKVEGEKYTVTPKCKRISIAGKTEQEIKAAIVGV